MAYTALKHFRAAGSGHLLNVSSLLGTEVRPNAGVYAGTKYAIKAHPRDWLKIEQLLTPADIARYGRFVLEQPPHVRIPVMTVLPGEQPL